jgi:hypothetical protein
MQYAITSSQKDIVLAGVISFMGIIPALFLPHGRVRNDGGAVMMV